MIYDRDRIYLRMKKRIGSYLSYIFFASVCAAAFLRFTDVRTAFLESLATCLRGILPPMFPMIVVSGTVAQLCPAHEPRRLSNLLAFLTGVSPGLLDAYAFGMLGGYPVGVKTLAQKIRILPAAANEAKLLALCAVNPGPAYAVLAVGQTTFGSARAGAVLYAAVTISNAMLFRFLKTRAGAFEAPSTDPETEKHVFLADALPTAVEHAVTASLQITAWVALFSALAAVLRPISSFAPVRLISEITAAVDCAHGFGSLPLCAFSLGFGGICLYAQLSGDLKTLSVRPRNYLLCRAAVGALSAGLTFLMIRLFPSVAAVFAMEREVRAFSSSPPASAALLLTCALFIAESASGGEIKKRLRPKYKS